MTPDRGSQMETQAPERIWAMPDKRLIWTHDDAGHQHAIEYVHADLYEAQAAQIATLQAEVERLRAHAEAG